MVHLWIKFVVLEDIIFIGYFGFKCLFLIVYLIDTPHPQEKTFMPQDRIFLIEFLDKYPSSFYSSFFFLLKLLWICAF